jgi:hypothetical protein
MSHVLKRRFPRTLKRKPDLEISRCYNTKSTFIRKEESVHRTTRHILNVLIFEKDLIFLPEGLVELADPTGLGDCFDMTLT